MPDRPKSNPIKSRNRVLGKSNPYPSLPMGGKTGEVLVKTSDESGEVDWGVVQGDGSVTPPFDPTYLEEKDKEQDDRLDAIEASPPPPPFDDSALKLKDSQQDDRMDDLEAEDQSQDARISDLEKIDPFDPTALIEKDEEQDDRLDALEAAPPGGGSYDDTAIWESQAEQDERLDLLEQMGGDADLWGTYKCQSSSSAPMAGQIRALPQNDLVLEIEWFFIHNETLNGNGLPLDQIDPGEHIRLTSPAGLVVDFTVTDVEDRTTYQKITVDKAATICSDPDSEWSVYWVAQSQVVFSLKQSDQGGGSYDDTAIWASQAEQDIQIRLIADQLGDVVGGHFEGTRGTWEIRTDAAPEFGQFNPQPAGAYFEDATSIVVSEEDRTNHGTRDLSHLTTGDEVRLYAAGGDDRWMRWKVSGTVNYVPAGTRPGYYEIPVSDGEVHGNVTANNWSWWYNNSRYSVAAFGRVVNDGGGSGSYDDTWLDGGSAGQVLTKSSGTDKDVYWATPSSGGGGGVSSQWVLPPITRQLEHWNDGQVQYAGNVRPGQLMLGNLYSQNPDCHLSVYDNSGEIDPAFDGTLLREYIDKGLSAALSNGYVMGAKVDFRLDFLLLKIENLTLGEEYIFPPKTNGVTITIDGTDPDKSGHISCQFESFYGDNFLRDSEVGHVFRISQVPR